MAVESGHKTVSIMTVEDFEAEFSVQRRGDHAFTDGDFTVTPCVKM